MAISNSNVKPQWQRSIISTSMLISATILITAMYWMRLVFIPVAFAIFLTYVLAPPVHFLQRQRFGRTVSVILVVGVALFLFLGSSYLIARQITSLSETLAENKDQIKEKIAQARYSIVGDGDSKWGKIFAEFEETLMPSSRAERSQVVRVESSQLGWVSRLDVIAGPATEAFGIAAFSFILVVFMLLTKEDLQDRFLRLIGDSGLAPATRATSEATRRISNYLFAQLMLNVIFGLICTVGLVILGVDYALLWGFLATLMRYVPYIGTWIGLIPPVLFSVAISDGWWQPLAVLTLYLGLELFCNNLVEPRLYGANLGVSEVALLISAAFWAFLWGPIGLILSGPITTCLLVLGKYLPEFRYLHVLLGTDPPLTPSVALYQRLMARNQDEAERVLENNIDKADPDKVFDETVIPALKLLKQARHDGQFDKDEERAVLEVADEVIDITADTVRKQMEFERTPGQGLPIRVLACPASDEADRLSLVCFTPLLSDSRWEIKVTSVDTLSSELLETVEKFSPEVILIGTMPPNGFAHVRYLCKRLRQRFPDSHIVVGRWGDLKDESIQTQFLNAGATAVAGSLIEARNLLLGWLPVFQKRRATISNAAKEEIVQKDVLVGTPTA